MKDGEGEGEERNNEIERWVAVGDRRGLNCSKKEELSLVIFLLFLESLRKICTSI